MVSIFLVIVFKKISS